MSELITLIGFLFLVAIVVVLTIAVIGFVALKEGDDERM